PTLPAGTEKVKITPYTGHKVEAYRNVYGPDGKLISSKWESTSDYKVRNKLILVGPQPAVAPELPPVELPPETELPPEAALPADGEAAIPPTPQPEVPAEPIPPQEPPAPPLA
ncbi:MAG: G5 domain-containing protein, partial [Oscillibacter sp.]